MNKSEPERVFDIEAHDKMITSVCFSNHSLKFLTGSQDGFMNVWSIQNETWKATPIELYDNNFFNNQNYGNMKFRIKLSNQKIKFT